MAITVTKKPLTASAPTVTSTKPYDGNASAAVTAGTLSGVLDGDDVTLTATATYDTKEVGSSKTITVTYSLEGTDAGNYIKPIDDEITNGEIVEAPMPTVDNQTYCEGETANRLTAKINTLFAPESEYDLIWYDSNKTLLAEAPMPTTAMKSGDNLKSDYVYYVTQKNKTTLAESGFATITVSILAHPSIADISAPASVVHGGSLVLAAPEVAYFGTISASSWEIETGIADTFTELASPYNVTFADNGKKLRYMATTGCGSEYSNEVAITVTKKQLEASAPTVTSTKPYDGNASAAITAGTLSGVLDGDDVTLTATATYDTKEVGSSKTITVVYTIAGADAGNYIKPIDDEITNGEIVEAPIPTVDNQTYCEGETANRLTAKINTLFAPESEYDLIWYDSNKTLLAEAPMPTTAMKSGDNLKSDYVYYVTQKNKTTLAESGFATITVSILAHPSISDISAPASVVHGGSLVLTAPEVAYFGTISASSWEIETGTAGTFAELASPYNVTFADNGKKLRYMATTGCGSEYSNEVAITVTKKPLTASAPTVTSTKPYDGNASAAVTAGTLSGVLDGDDVTLTATATYDTKEVGSSKTITVTYSLEGADAGNYIAPSDYTTSGEITSISLAIGQIEAPAAICSGNALTLSEPTVEDRGFAYTGRWEISGDDFNTSTVYLGQELKEEQNGWSLRYAAESSYGTFYSNVVKITVNLDPSYIGMMWDDVLVCSNAKEIQFTAWQWYYNGSAIDGATKAFYSSPSIGVGYQVAATAQDGRTYFSCPLSGNLKSQSVSIKSYPNPSLASEPMKIEVTGLSDELLKGATLTAYSAAGVQVLSLNNVSEINEIRLPQGIYVVVLRANGRTLSTKVMRR